MVEMTWRRAGGAHFQPTLDNQAGSDGPVPTASTSAMRLWP